MTVSYLITLPFVIGKLAISADLQFDVVRLTGHGYSQV